MRTRPQILSSGRLGGVISQMLGKDCLRLTDDFEMSRLL